MRKLKLLIIILFITSCGPNSTEYLVIESTEESRKIIKVGWGQNRLSYFGKLFTGELVNRDRVVFFESGKPIKVNVYCDIDSSDTPLRERQMLETFNYWADGISMKDQARGSNEKHYIDRVEGEFITYYCNGQIKSKESHTKGKRNGEYLSYFDNGQIEKKYNYINGKLDGESLYYSKGWQDAPHALKTKENYINGKKDGEFFLYFAPNKRDNVGIEEIQFKRIYDNDILVYRKEYAFDRDNNKFMLYEDRDEKGL